LLDLKTKKELQFTHHRHLESLGHDPTKLFTKFIISRPKYNIININLENKDAFSISLNEESRIDFAYLKTILEKKILKPIQSLMELVHMV
jgi:N12 class adenine-specific DNA methylase